MVSIKWQSLLFPAFTIPCQLNAEGHPHPSTWDSPSGTCSADKHRSTQCQPAWLSSLCSASLEAIHAPSHLSISHPYSFSHHSLFPFLSLYPCCCEPCPFTFLPSAAISFCIIVLCTEKAKRTTKKTPFAHRYPLFCVIPPKKPLMKILHLCWLYAAGLRISFFPSNA